MRTAYNLARWLVRNDDDAEDVVRESFVKVCKAQASFRGDARTSLLAIVRNTAHGLLQSYEEMSLPEPKLENGAAGAIARLELEIREVIVLREIERLSYKEIAAVLSIPLGTVMSRLAHGRKLLLAELSPPKEVAHDLP